MHTNFENEIEKYPTTSPGEALAITVLSLFAAWAVIELANWVFGAETVINWVAGLVS